MKKLNSSGFGISYIIITLLIVSSAGFIGWRVYRSRTTTKSVSSVNEKSLNKAKQKTTDSTVKKETPKIPSGWKQFTSTGYHFSFAYPEDWGDLTKTDISKYLGTSWSEDYWNFWYDYFTANKIDTQQKNGISGNLSVSIVDINYTGFNTGKAEPGLTFKSDDSGGYWAISNSADPASLAPLKPGQKADVPLKKILEDVSIFKVDGGYECNNNSSWWLVFEKYVVMIDLPSYNYYKLNSNGICDLDENIPKDFVQKTYQQILDTIEIL